MRKIWRPFKRTTDVPSMGRLYMPVVISKEEKKRNKKRRKNEKNTG